jgi:hypothetical protein
MATGHSVIPIDDEQLTEKGVLEYLKDTMIFVPANIPRGRFPTLTELRHSIQQLGYDLEETHDWYVTSKDDSTEIWFSSKNREENAPVEFWFRRGANIVWNITQALTNECGSLLVLNHSGSPNILFVPETVFSPDSLLPPATDYFEVMRHRLPLIIERLSTASDEDKLFYLSQIHQVVYSTKRMYQPYFFEELRPGVDAFARLLKHKDSRIRYLAFDLITFFSERFFDTAASLKWAIQNETDSATKTRMIHALERLVVPSSVSGAVYEPIKGVLAVLSSIHNNREEPLPVQLIAAHLLARSQPGLLTSSIQRLFIDALIHPDQYDKYRYSGYSITQQVLKSLEKMLLNYRIQILLTALPEINTAQQAHDVLRALLDHLFFGSIYPTAMSSLPDAYLAERPEVDESKIDKNLSRNWLYPANPTKLVVEELLPFQRKVLETALSLNIPWMIHSNLLEKYRLPATRASVREMLE